MSRPLVVRMVLAFVLCAVLVSCPALAAEPRGAGGPKQAEPWYGWLLDAITALWGENGCSADPFGTCGETPSNLDAGCRFDPYGGCEP